jgi:hypothetical protein
MSVADLVEYDLRGLLDLSISMWYCSALEIPMKGSQPSSRFTTGLPPAACRRGAMTHRKVKGE